MYKTASGNYHNRPSQVMGSQLLMKECRLSELEPRTSRNCDPNDVEAHPCRGVEGINGGHKRGVIAYVHCCSGISV